MEVNKILIGNSVDVLKTLEPNSVSCCVTSPPYWMLRDYGNTEQLGNEPDFNDYIKKLCDIFDGVKTALREDGTCWVNLGDTYYNPTSKKTKEQIQSNPLAKNIYNFTANSYGGMHQLPNKCLVGIPMRFAIEMMNRGWILRNTIIWHKNNSMPSPVKDRFTPDFEYVFFFTKNKNYWFETQYEPLANSGIKHDVTKDFTAIDKGRLKRTLWEVNTKPSKEKHFAPYPKELTYIPIRSGCPELICNNCNTPRIRIIDEEKRETKRSIVIDNKYGSIENESNHRQGFNANRVWKKPKFLGLRYSDCGCKSTYRKGIVLDPFIGSGSSAISALELGRDFIGIELNDEYAKMANERIKQFMMQTKLTEWSDKK